jgi:hypothetical protein
MAAAARDIELAAFVIDRNRISVFIVKSRERWKKARVIWDADICAEKLREGNDVRSGTNVAQPYQQEGKEVMSLVRLLGFTTLTCGCVVGKYREVATSREVMYIEEKGKSCGSHSHRRNHTVVADRFAPSSLVSLASKAS